ncbi:MAG TPA: DUF2169 domain-containing protein [Polyangia bacterium]|nr:DUF2169 domain-containing protein [Polyangia bacterium]
MQLDNQTPFAARLLRFQRAETSPVDGTLVVKATFQQDHGRRWVPAGEQLPFADAPLETAFGVFHGDGFVKKDGVDVCVLGTIRLARAMRATEVRLSVGSRNSTLLVYGDRQWRTGRGDLVASSPELFQQMPLSYGRAYGGRTEYDYEELVWPDNPVGRGYYLTEQAALGQPLPNVETAAVPPIRHWSDQPGVGGWGPYPSFWGIRSREGVKSPERPEAGNFGKITPRLNNHAHPELVMPMLPDDAEITIRGMRPEVLTYAVPRLPVRLDVVSGGTVIARPQPRIDGVFIWADQGLVTVTGRVSFTYPYTKGEVRGARLALVA